MEITFREFSIVANLMIVLLVSLPSGIKSDGKKEDQTCVDLRGQVSLKLAACYDKTGVEVYLYRPNDNRCKQEKLKTKCLNMSKDIYQEKEKCEKCIVAAGTKRPSLRRRVFKPPNICDKPLLRRKLEKDNCYGNEVTIYIWDPETKQCKPTGLMKQCTKKLKFIHETEAACNDFCKT